MRKIVLFSCSLLLTLTSFTQDFPGYRAGNYTGVNGVFFNPANIADSRYRWDVNLVSVSASVGNNQGSFKLKNITETFNDDSLVRQFIGRKGTATSGMVSAVVHGPSFMFNAGQKGAFAISSRARIMTNAIDLDGELANSILDNDEDLLSLPYTINSNKNMRVSFNAWTEFGLSYGRVLSDKGAHFFKGGVTLKYLAGAANGFVNIDNLQATLDEDGITGDPYLSNATGRFQLGFGGVELDDFDADKLTAFESTGFGADIGFVYEYRPDHESYRMESSGWQRDRNKYKFRVGVALLDIGSIRYKRDQQRSAVYDLGISGAERFYPGDLDNVEFDNLKDFFDGRPQFFTPVAGMGGDSYNVGLPTTLNIDADYHFHRGFYMSLSGMLSMVNTNNKAFNSQYFSSIGITPRYEGRAVGVYLPVSYNKLTNLNAGISLRFGPIFFGSGSVLTALIDKSKQADMHVGVRFGGLQKDKIKKQEKKDRKAARKAAKNEE